MTYPRLAELADAADRAAERRALPAGTAAAEIRLRAGASPTECAAAVGVSERTWSRFERGATHRFAAPAIEVRAARVLAFLQDAESLAIATTRR